MAIPSLGCKLRCEMLTVLNQHGANSSVNCFILFNSVKLKVLALTALSIQRLLLQVIGF